MYSNKFIDHVEFCFPENYIGIGNPNADILIIGKEANITKAESLAEYNENAHHWKIKTDKQEAEKLEYPVTRDHELYQGWGKNT